MRSCAPSESEDEDAGASAPWSERGVWEGERVLRAGRR